MKGKSEGQRHTRSVSGIGAHAVVDMALLDLNARVAHGPRRVLAQHFLLFGRHQAEEDTRLLVVVVDDTVVVVVGVPLDCCLLYTSPSPRD